MSGNQWANQYGQKSNTTKQAARKAVDVGNQNTQALQQIQQMVFGMSYKMYELEQKLQRADQVARIADTRSMALQKLVSKAGISEAEVMAEVMNIQEIDFDIASKSDDATRGLTDAGADAAATTGQAAITTISFFKDGVEVTDERIVRSKIELGKKELLNGLLDDVITGMKVGDTKDFEFTLTNKINSGKVTLLGLRNPAPAPAAVAQEEASPAQEENNA